MTWPIFSNVGVHELSVENTIRRYMHVGEGRGPFLGWISKS